VKTRLLGAGAGGTLRRTIRPKLSSFTRANL
jgi:hypothetical protein